MIDAVGSNLKVVSAIILALSLAGCSGHDGQRKAVEKGHPVDRTLVAGKLKPYAVRIDREESPFELRFHSVECPHRLPDYRGY
jgi:hypothetical protein